MISQSAIYRRMSNELRLAPRNEQLYVDVFVSLSYHTNTQKGIDIVSDNE